MFDLELVLKSRGNVLIFYGTPGMAVEKLRTVIDIFVILGALIRYV